MIVSIRGGHLDVQECRCEIGANDVGLRVAADTAGVVRANAVHGVGSRWGRLAPPVAVRFREGGAEEQRKARQQDLERLLQRYNNVKAELEASQNAERRKHRPGGSSLSVAISHVPETPRSLSRRVSTAESLSQLHR